MGAARVPLGYRAEVSCCEKPACLIASGTRRVYGKTARELEAEKATQRRSPTYCKNKPESVLGKTGGKERLRWQGCHSPSSFAWWQRERSCKTTLSSSASAGKKHDWSYSWRRWSAWKSVDTKYLRFWKCEVLPDNIYCVGWWQRITSRFFYLESFSWYWTTPQLILSR